MDWQSTGRSPPPSDPYNGHHHGDMTMGLLLGQILGRNDQQIELLREIRDAKHATTTAITQLSQDVQRLPDAVAAKVPQPQPRAPRKLLAACREWLQLIVPLAVLALAVAGKIAWTDAIGHIKSVAMP